MSFERAFVLTMVHEGGFVADPKDKGGATKFGVSQARYPDLDIKSLTLDGAKALYKKDFWDEFRCGDLPWPLAYTLFDSVVQFHPKNPIRWLQAAVGVNIDGALGPKTIEAANRCREPVTAAVTLMAARGEYRLQHAQYSYFGRGWRRRDLNVMADAARFAGVARA